MVNRSQMHKEIKFKIRTNRRFSYKMFKFKFEKYISNYTYLNEIRPEDLYGINFDIEDESY